MSSRLFLLNPCINCSRRRPQTNGCTHRAFYINHHCILLCKYMSQCKYAGCMQISLGSAYSMAEFISAPLPAHIIRFLAPGQTPGYYIPEKEGLLMNRWACCKYPDNFDLMEPGWNTPTFNVVLLTPDLHAAQVGHKGRMPHETHPLSRTRIGRWTFFLLCSSFWRSPTFGLTQRVRPQSAPPILHKSRLVTIVAIVKAIGVCSISSGVASPHCSHALG